MTRLGEGTLAQGTTPELESPVTCDGPRALLLEAREVPLGGVRAMQVHRSLPQRALPMVGAWCFLDRFGPQVAKMRVEPHPHIGLQTVTWPFVGVTRHRDVLGNDVEIRRGELNIMTSGAGIAHSEYSVGEDEAEIDALQFWVALPESRRHGPPDFEQIRDLPVVDLGDGACAAVVVGSFAGVDSPARMYTPIVGAEVFVPAGVRVTLPLNPAWEHALVGVEGAPSVPTGPVTEGGVDAGGTMTVAPQQLLYLGLDRTRIEVAADTDTTVFLIGGEPFEADIVMWWNFVGRAHEEIVDAREAWESDTARFGHVVGHGDERIPAPPMPGVRLTQRRRRA
ncbi:pirin family protein [Microbacterium sp. MC2]